MPVAEPPGCLSEEGTDAHNTIRELRPYATGRTPYQKATQVWDDRIGSARVQARNWRLMAFGCLLLSGGLAAALVWRFTRGTITPWVVKSTTSVRPRRSRQRAPSISRPTRRLRFTSRGLSKMCEVYQQTPSWCGRTGYCLRLRDRSWRGRTERLREPTTRLQSSVAYKFPLKSPASFVPRRGASGLRGPNVVMTVAQLPRPSVDR